MYYKSRTDFNIVQVPQPVPGMGPAGSRVTDPDFGNAIVRATDEHSMTNGQFAQAGIGGSADVNTWNTDSTMLYLQDTGGLGCVFGFEPQTLAVARLFPFWRPGALIFSRLDPNVAFGFKNGQFLRFDLSDRKALSPPAPSIVCDFATLLPGPITWAAVGGVEASDTVFTCGFSISGAQGTGIYACAYRIGSGFRIFNTGIGTVTGDYGFSGGISIADRFTIHNLKQSKDGKYLVIAMTLHPSGTGHSPFAWEIDTTNVFPLGGDGHWTAGYEEFIDNGSGPQIPYWSHRRRDFHTLATERIAKVTPKITPPLDDHLSLNGPQKGMFVSFSTDTGHWPTFPGPWYNEVLGFDLDGSGRVYRFCHTFCSGKSGFFAADNAIGVVDQLNKFAAWTSDWMGTLAGNRKDVFIVKLR
jgi:hypothetical protein